MSHRECTTLSGCCCLLNGREEVMRYLRVTHKSQRFFTRSPFERGKKNKNTKKTKKTKTGLISRNKVNRSIFNIRYSLRNYSSHVDWFSKQHQAWICSSNLLVEKKYINAFVTVDPKLDF